jgi:hypothetical protein
MENHSNLLKGIRMTRPLPGITLPAALFLVLALAAACASSNVLSVRYELAPRTEAPAGRTVTIAFTDERKTDAFLTPSARNELEGFTGVFALTVAPAGKSGELKGAFPLDALFRELLRHRLESAGVGVAPAGAPAAAEIQLVLNEFQLDFGDRKWSSAVAYRVQLVKAGSVRSQQLVSGSAERVFLTGRREADRVVGELLSDAINKLDVPLLFTQAGL